MGEVAGGILGAFGLSASAGLNAYIPLLVLGLLAKYTHLITLSEPWDALTSGWAILALVLLSLVEFFADKIPAVDHINDAIQTFIRPTAGAILFAASAKSVSDVNPVLALVAGLLVAGTVHTVKSVAVRPMVTVTTGGMADPVVSALEDGVAVVVSVLSVVLPVLVIFFLALVIWTAVRWIRKRRKSAVAV